MDSCNNLVHVFLWFELLWMMFVLVVRLLDPRSWRGGNTDVETKVSSKDLGMAWIWFISQAGISYRDDPAQNAHVFLVALFHPQATLELHVEVLLRALLIQV